MNIKLPNVALVVTSYNYEKYILDCLESIQQQTYPHLECIVIDDCSTDNSIALIEDFINKNNKNNNFHVVFRLVKHSKNKGQLESFITGIKEAGDAVFLGL